jgi:hypothetical protein
MKIRIGLIILLLLLAGYFALAIGEASFSSWKPITMPEKSEGKKLLLNPDTHTYDFIGITNPSSTSIAYTGYNWGNETEFSTDYYGYISYNDDVWADSQGGNVGDRPHFRMRFKIDEAVTNITQIDVSVKGHGGTHLEGDEPFGWTFYIYNFNAPGWELLDTNDFYEEDTQTGQITSSITNYIDGSGYVEIGMITNSSSAGGTGIYLDYPFATVTYTPPTANAQLIMISE